MTMQGTRVVAVFVFLEQGLSLESWAGGRSTRNSPSPYGYAAASDAVRMSWSTDRDESGIGRRLRRAVYRLLGFDLVHAWRNRAALNEADVVWTHTENEALAALALLQLLRNRRTRVIAQSVWLWDDWGSRSSARRRAHLRLLDRAAVEITLSEYNRDHAREVRGTQEVYFLPFGAAINESVAARIREDPVDGAETYVLAIGSDRDRDWETLVAAARLLPDLRFRVATLSRRFPSDLPPNLAVTPAGSLEESYRMYARADLVVLPLKPNLHASGCTVAVEAQAFDVPLVTTDVGGIRSYLDGGVHLYEAGDATSLAAVIAAAARTPRARTGSGAQFLRDAGLTEQDYAARMLLVTRWVVEGGGFPVQVEALAPLRHVLDQER
ncbi:glycosyltransferase [Microbacterium caowuchunii]|uniref:glycosyltransferase n=1 Tax=Microbacterium caowuchunii TaxID=2614638 RepID=UPI00177E1123|nr:glycosyltransferase [Microbacterium caowuchunii]